MSLDDVEKRRKQAKRSPEVALLARVAAGQSQDGDSDRLRGMVAALRQGRDANKVFGITREDRGTPKRHYQRDQNVMRVVRVRELMACGLTKEDALPQAAKELGDVAESTLADLYKKYWRQAATFLKIENDYADEIAALDNPTPDMREQLEGPYPNAEDDFNRH